MRTENEAPTPRIFFTGFLNILELLTFLSGKMDQAVPEIMFLEAYLIVCSEITHTFSKG